MDRLCKAGKGQEKMKPARKFIKVGKTYGYIHVTGMADRAYRAYDCECLKCGNKFVGDGSTVNKFAGTGCTECRKKESDKAREEEARTYINKRFGELKIVGFVGIRQEYKHETPVMLCKCLKCGNETEIPLSRLKAGQAKQCKECAKKNLAVGMDIARMAEKGGSSVLAVKDRAINKNSATGITGVNFMPETGKYRAYIHFQRKAYHLGSFEKKEDAAEARRAAEKEIYGNFVEWYKNTYPEYWERLNKIKKKNNK